MSSFTTTLKASPVDDKYWEILEEFNYEIGELGSGNIVHVEKGFITDFASSQFIKSPLIPMLTMAMTFLGHQLGINWLFWLGVILTGLVTYILFLPAWGARYGKAAVIHDWLYQHKVESGLNLWQRMVSKERARADYLFFEGMTVLHAHFWRKYPMYWGVRIGGWMAWKDIPAVPINPVPVV
jgi:hypothetical protein